MGLSNIEDILQAGLDGETLPTPESRIAELLKEWIEQGGNIDDILVAGSNITLTKNADGTITIAASGEVSSEDTVARAEIAAIKDGETLDSFGDVETALSDKQNTISDLSTIRSGAALGATAVQPETGKGLSTNDFTDTLKDKLDGIESGAEANVQADWEQIDTTADDYIKGKPTIPTVNDSTITIQKNGTTVKSFTTNQASGDTINITVPTSAADVSAIPTSAKGTASGVAELDSNGKVPSSQLPSYVDDVIEGYYYNGKFYEESAHTTEITGETGKIYIDLSGTNKTYRWSGSGYTEISESLALGETSSTAYRGDRGKTAYDHATESRLTTATASGLYKVASTAEGHIASLTSVQKSDITGLGIPAQDTTYTFEGTYNASTNKAATMADIKDGKLTGYAQNSGDVAATDTVVEAIGKVEKKADDNKNNISLIKQVPTVEAGDNGKVLTAGSSSYSWTTPTITGVKGGQESTYRTGKVSISAANILSTAQQNAVNSGVTSTTVSQVETNTTNISKITPTTTYKTNHAFQSANYELIDDVYIDVPDGKRIFLVVGAKQSNVTGIAVCFNTTTYDATKIVISQEVSAAQQMISCAGCYDNGNGGQSYRMNVFAKGVAGSQLNCRVTLSWWYL